MIRYELFYLDCMTSSLDWKTKQITIKNNIKYIHITINHYKFPDTEITNIINNTLQIPFTINTIKQIWLDNIDKYNKLFGINFNNLVLGIDYIIAPIYIHIHSNSNNNNIIVGIFLLSSLPEIKNINKNVEIKIQKYICLSSINTSNTITNTTNKWIILNGILQYKNYNIESRDMDNKYLELDINNKILWKHIFINARNYLPKIEVIVKEPFKISINFRKNQN